MPTSISVLDSASSAQTIATIDALLAVFGGLSDSAWSGSGNATLTALAKAIAAQALSTADTNVQPHQPSSVIAFTPTLQTSAYVAGRVLFATTAIANVSRANDQPFQLSSLAVTDKSDQKPAFTLLFFSTNVTSGAANVANTLSDTDATTFLGMKSVAAADWKDMGANALVSYSNINLLMRPAGGTSLVYCFGILDAGTPTFALGDLVIQFGVVQA